MKDHTAAETPPAQRRRATRSYAVYVYAWGRRGGRRQCGGHGNAVPFEAFTTRLRSAAYRAYRRATFRGGRTEARREIGVAALTADRSNGCPRRPLGVGRLARRLRSTSGQASEKIAHRAFRDGLALRDTASYGRGMGLQGKRSVPGLRSWCWRLRVSDWLTHQQREADHH